MTNRTVECLRCGDTRDLGRSPECPRCGYLGWAEPQDLTERVRKVLRTRPPELRRVRAV
ncbi:MAG: hypothetical protein M3321_00560 [Actinomycetota bacterium]|nr:hypothetical protein [Actinomycetota bacterium]